MWEINRKIFSTRRWTCIDRNDVLKHCVPLSAHPKRAGWAAAAVRCNESSSTQEHLCRDIHQGAGCTCLGSHGYRSWREATRPARVCCVQVLNSECLSVYHQGSSHEAEYKSQLILLQPKLTASRDFQGTCTLVFRLTVLRLRKEHSLCCSWQEQMIKIQVSQEQQSQPEATDPEAAIERQQVWADLAALLSLNLTLDDVWS